ncbi:hypothetical protein GEMRC1_004887 [Eukaryota sp. GEM-RC1]
MHLGIDFSTTGLVVYADKNGTPEVQLNSQTHRLFIQWLTFDESGRQFGDAAKVLCFRNLDRSFWNITFLLSDLNAPFPFVSQSQPNDGFPINLREQRFQISLPHLLAMLFSHLFRELCDLVQCQQLSVTCSLPLCLNKSQRRLLQEILQYAGFHDVTIVDPIYCLSWSYLYKMNSRLTNQLEVILFLDIGYMCTDIGVVQMNNESANILLSKSSTSFRGQLLDQELLQLCVDKANQLFNQDVTQNKKSMFRLYQEIKKTRVNLSSCPEVELDIDSFIDGEDFEIDVNRRDFEASLEHHLLQLGNLLTKVDQFFVKNSLKLSKVVLLGGFSYVPVIETTIKSHFGYLQSRLFERTLNAFESVSEGALLSELIQNEDTFTVINHSLQSAHNQISDERLFDSSLFRELEDRFKQIDDEEQYKSTMTTELLKKVKKTKRNASKRYRNSLLNFVLTNIWGSFEQKVSKSKGPFL